MEQFTEAELETIRVLAVEKLIDIADNTSLRAKLVRDSLNSILEKMRTV